MWIVRLALRKPYTFTVMAILILIMGVVSFNSMPKDIFPSIDIPVVSVIWSYAGLPPQEMERRFTNISERAMTTTVNDIEHQESQNYPGTAAIKVFFQPNVKIEQAVAQVTAISQTLLRVFPPGATPPLIIQYSASSVPILQLAVSSKTLPEAELYDQSLNFIRQPLANVPGASVPLPYGGKQRLVSVDLDLRKCQSLGISPLEVSNAINAQSVILPSGTVKIGDREYNVLLNSSPSLLDQLNGLPVRQSNGATIYIRDVAQVRDGYAPQINMVKLNGEKAALLPVLKNGSASTVNVVNGVLNLLPQIKTTLPASLDVQPLFDQSIFVKAALQGVLVEGSTAATLTALMILLFLGSWRSTIIVAISIPLAICCSLIAMAAMGLTINIMTLGGLALAVGILVDDATVTIENIHRHMSLGKRMVKSILDGAHQIAIPAFVSTLCICIVFVPVFFLRGVAYYLFTPLALAVVFAMMASYFLSRTVAPTMANFLLGAETHHPEGYVAPRPDGLFARIHWHFIRGFEWSQGRYVGFLERVMRVPALVVLVAITFVVLTLAIFTPFLGRDFFPQVDAGQFRLHIRAPSGTRIEETDKGFSQVESIVRQVIPPDEINMVLDNIGLPVGGVNLAFTDSATSGPFDGEMLVSLQPGHKSTWDYVKTLRHRLKEEMPNYEFFTQPADIVGQILNFGLPAPIDVQVIGPAKNGAADYQVALKLLNRLRNVRGAVDVHIQQVTSYPTFFVDVDRTRADQIGLTERDVATDLLISLSGSFQTAPNYWLNPVNGVNYNIAVQTPQYKIDSLNALKQSPISAGKLAQPQLLENLAPIRRTDTAAVISHYNIKPVYDVCVNVQGRDLGGVSDDVAKIVSEFKPAPPANAAPAAAPAPPSIWTKLGMHALGLGFLLNAPPTAPPDPNSVLPTGSQIIIRGQVSSMNSAYFGLGIGIIFAIGLVYFLMVVNFQSWLDPFIIIMALPGALSGIVLMLFLTNTPLSVPALMGAIMCIGVATANSILVVSFANEQRHGGLSAFDAALAAGRTRLRPVIMTALAMIIGMLPMSLGLGEGGEQNAPLGRAVIGGLLVATMFTLLFVPVVYSVLRRKDQNMDVDPLLFEPNEYEVTDVVDMTGRASKGTAPKLPRPAAMATRATCARRPVRKSDIMSPMTPSPKKNPPAPAAAVEPIRRKKSGFGSLALIVIVLLGVGAALYFFGFAPRLAASGDLDREQKISTQRVVVYSLARLAEPKVELPLPGTMEAFQQASIYARTNGYVKSWLRDIGDVVQEGDPLAEIDTPEVDQQLSQAKATSETAQAAVNIAQIAADRWNVMVKDKAVSQEEADEKNATLAEAKATLNADQANVGQLTAQENFKHVVAPFTGKITFRNIEVGNLVTVPTGNNANTSGTTEIYRIAQTDPLRVYVDVPEAASRSIQPGVEADLHVAAYPDRVFHGEVVRSAGALDTTSRTLRTEIRVANPDGTLLPGSFAEVRLNLVDGAPAVLIPANTLIVNAAGTQVALLQNVDGQDQVHFLPVQVGRDFGTEVEILKDVKDGDRLVTNPPADLNEGAVVTAKALPKPPTPPPVNPVPKT